MINLLPNDIKLSYRYARRNVTLRRWLFAFVLALVGLGIIATYGLLTLHQSSVKNSNMLSTANSDLKKEHLSQTKQQVQDISNSLKLAVQVLGKEVLFSKLITQIGAAMPDGANLTGLSINNVSGGIELSAVATNYTTATQVQVNLTSPANKIFSKADIESVTCGSEVTTIANYPCKVDVRALFDSNNQFLFINQGKS